jgi:glycosyltransferase involved in cell wall biosynthesis
VLILCYFYPPLAGGGVHRVLSFTRHLPAHGWSCTVVCAGEEDYWVKDETLTAAIPTGTEVIRVPGGSALSAWRRVFRRGDRLPGQRAGLLRSLSDWWLLPDSYIGWAPRARAAAAKRMRLGGVDVVLSSSPPESAHVAALPLGERFGVPWVADFRDPWIGLYRRQPPTAWHARRQGALERRVMERADLVITASRTQMSYSERGSGARPSRAEVVFNGFDAAQPAPAAADTGDRGAGASETFLLVFTGTLSHVPDTEVFFEALHELFVRHPDARRRLRVELAGPFDPGYEDRSVALGLKGIVTFMGQRSHQEVRELQRRADLLLLWIPRVEVLRAALPGKLYEYLDAGRPIVALLDERAEAAELVRKADGRVFPVGARSALAGELERRWLAWKSGARDPVRRPAWLDDYRRDVQAASLARLLDGLVARPS